MIRTCVTWAVGASAAVALAAAAAIAQHGGETFQATASVTRGEARASAPITMTVARYSSPTERDAVLAALRDGGTAEAKRVLARLEDVGVIEMGGRRTPIKFAAARPTGAGRLVTILTAEPMLFLGAGLPDAQPRQGYELAAALLDVRDDGAGLGELAPAAKIAIGKEGAVLIDDYGATVVWLQNLFRAR
jgi:hypothetical protein